MKIIVKKTLSGLVPVDRSEFDKLQEAKLKLGQEYQVEIKRPRNLKFHRKYFSLINLCFENQEQFESIEDMRCYIQMKAGYYKRIETTEGEMFLPKSISFAKMDNLEFSELYDNVLQQVIKLLGCDKEDIFEILKDF